MSKSILFVKIYLFRLWGDFVAACRLSLVVASEGYPPVEVHRVLSAVASLVAEQGCWMCGLQLLQYTGSGVVAHGL